MRTTSKEAGNALQSLGRGLEGKEGTGGVWKGRGLEKGELGRKREGWEKLLGRDGNGGMGGEASWKGWEGRWGEKLLGRDGKEGAC